MEPHASTRRGRGLCGALAALVAAVVVAQSAVAQPPAMDIYLAPLEEGDGAIAIGPVVNVTQRPGYDNQPCFDPEGRYLLYSSQDSSGQTDVFRYWIADARRERLTHTPESEYSPTILPGGEGFSSVRVEADGTQRLWRFDLDGIHPALVLAGVDSVGYHVWADDHTLVLFIVGEPHSLRVVDVREEGERLVALDIGRALHRIPGSADVSFTRRLEGDELWFFRLRRPSLESERMFPALEGSEDCAWTPGGVLLMASGSEVYARDPGGEGDWRRVAELGGIDGITRLSVDPAGARIALVGSDP